MRLSVPAPGGSKVGVDELRAGSREVRESDVRLVPRPAAGVCGGCGLHQVSASQLLERRRPGTGQGSLLHCHSMAEKARNSATCLLVVPIQVLAGFQKFGQPSTVPVTPPSGHTPSLLSPCIQGVQYGVRCLAQLTATQYAATTSPGHTPPMNQGRLILFCSLCRSLSFHFLFLFFLPFLFIFFFFSIGINVGCKNNDIA